MNVITTIKMDISKPDPSLTVNAVQGDRYSRSLNISLRNNHQPWTIPEDVSIGVRYLKPDCTKGYYDTLPDGTNAWQIHDNMLTIHLAPQMLTVSGNVKMQVELVQGMSILTTFSLKVYVESNPAAGILKSENYINWLQWIQDKAQDQVKLTQQAAGTACQASQAAALAAEHARTFADQAQNAANTASAAQEETKAIAAKVSATVAGNEAYTKEESDLRYCPAFIVTATGKAIAITDSTDLKLQGLRLFGKTIYDGTPAPDTPIDFISSGDIGNIQVTVSGKNLCPGYKKGAYLAGNGIYQELNNYYCTELIPVVPEIVYTESNGIRQTVADTHFFNKDKKWLGKESYATYLNNRPNGTAYIAFNYWNSTDLGWIQLEIGSSATNYEPYTEHKTLTISTPNGLSGIPVTFSGNYTDEAGQHWLCDEIDFPSRISIQRVGKVDSYNGEPVGETFLSSTGLLTSGATVLYPLAEPVVTSLSEEELANYSAMHTNYPNTTILNDGDSGMMVSYTADLKLYIDNKFATPTTAAE